MLRHVFSKCFHQLYVYLMVDKSIYLKDILPNDNSLMQNAFFQ